MPLPGERLGEYVDRMLYAIFGGLLRRFVVLTAHDAADALARTAALRARGFATSFDLMVEDVREEDAIERVMEFYLTLLARMDERDRGNIVIKPTALGLIPGDETGLSRARCKERIRRLLGAVWGMQNGTHPVEIEIDAESTRTIATAFAIVDELRREYPIAARRFRLAVPMHIAGLEKLVERYRLFAFPVRIVKGAGVYDEPPGALAHEHVVLTRYQRYALGALERGTHPYIATVRDWELLVGLFAAFTRAGHGKEDYTIEMLYGLWGGLARRLLAEGHRVALYVPVVLPWCASASDGYVRRRVKTRCVRSSSNGRSRRSCRDKWMKAGRCPAFLCAAAEKRPHCRGP